MAAPPHVLRQPWESAAGFATRVRWLRERFGDAPPADAAEAMRQVSLSMVWANQRALNCKYPHAVANSVGAAGRGARGDGAAAAAAAAAAATGTGGLLAFEGERRTAAAVAAYT